MFTHQLSCSKEEYSAITSGKKSFILTKDRDYQTGDQILLQFERSQETYPVTIVEGDVAGLAKNYVIVGFANNAQK